MQPSPYLRVPDQGSRDVCRKESGAAGEDAADHPLPQSQGPGVKPETVGAAAAGGRVAAKQERQKHL